MKSNNILIFKALSEDSTNTSANTSPKDVYQEHLENLNLSVKIVNVLDFKFTNLDILQQKLDNPEEFSGIVFGSPRCVNAVSKAVDKLNDRWKNLPVFAVGETTGQLISDKLELKAEGTQSGHGAALAPIILKYNLPRPVLIPCGNLSRDTIVKILQENGIATETVQVYETIPHPDLETKLKKAIEGFTINVIVYFSPSGIQATLPLLEKFSVPIKEIKFVSIGPTTEKALKDLGFEVSATAAKPTPDSLASAVASVLN